MNFLQIAGHLGADPEERFTQGGQKVTTLRLATHSRKGGQDQTIWWRVTIWGDRFDKMMPHLKKGSPLIVAGEMSKPDIYTDKEGKPRVSLDMVAEVIRFSPFGRGNSNDQEGGRSMAQSSAPAQAQGSSQSNNMNDFDDEIPF